MPALAPRLVLHIGAMKTGTTYLQNLLEANTSQLADQGWWAPDQRRVVRAVRELMALTDDGRASATDAPRWASLVDDARAHAAAGGHGTVVSMEFLSYARKARVQRIVAGAHGLDLEVVLTVRDAVRAIPSQWQSLSRNGHSLSWPDFAGAVRASGLRRVAPGVKSFRRTQDIPRMLEAWGRTVPPERFHAVTVPGSSEPRSLLWERFLSVVGVDPAATTLEAAFDNPQLGYGSCELLRLVNGAGLGAEQPSAYRKVVRRLTREHLLALRDEQTRPRMDRASAEFAVELNARTLAAIDRWATLVGSAADLPTAVGDHHDLDAGSRPAQVAESEVHRAAVVLHAGAVALCAGDGLDLPADLTAELPAALPAAIEQVAAVMGVAITGDVSHRPRPRGRHGWASTVSS